MSIKAPLEPPMQAPRGAPPDVSVVVTTYRAVEHLRCCVRSLLGTSDPAGIEVAIWGDGGGDASREAILRSAAELRDAGFRVAAHYEPKNEGIARALNRAATMASGTWLYVVNDDMAFPRSWWDRGKPLLEPRRVLGTSAAEPPVPGRRRADCFHTLDLGTDPVAFEAGGLDAFQESLPPGPLEPGVNYPFYVERDVFFEVGGADERFPGPYHDPDLFLRLKLAGVELRRANHLVLYHFSGASLRYGARASGARGRQTFDWVLRENEARLEFVRKWGAKPATRFGYVPRTRATEPWEGRPHGPIETLRYRALMAWEALRAAVRERRYRRGSRSATDGA